MAGGQSRLSDIHAHPAPGTGDEPNFAHVSVSYTNNDPLIGSVGVWITPYNILRRLTSARA
jgi:hypothetical protein